MREGFLVSLIHGLNSKQWFFIGWGVLVAGLVWMFWSTYRKSTRRNFRESNPYASTGERSLEVRKNNEVSRK